MFFPVEEHQATIEHLLRRRLSFAQSKAPAIYKSVTRHVKNRHGRFCCSAGLRAEDLADINDSDIAKMAGLPAGIMLAFLIIGASAKVDLQQINSPWELDRLHAQLLRETLELLREDHETGCELVLSIWGSDPAALPGHSLVQTCFVVLMEELYKEAQRKQCVPPVTEIKAEDLEGAHRMLFDVFLHVLHRWAKGVMLPQIFGEQTEELYGMIGGDLWRSRLVGKSPKLLKEGERSLQLYMKLKRPFLSPWSMQELLGKASKLFGL